MTKTNEDYLHLLEGTKEARTIDIIRDITKRLREDTQHELTFEDVAIIDRIRADITRAGEAYTQRGMDYNTYDLMKAGINNILEHYELTNGIYTSRFQLWEAWDEGRYYVNLELQPRQPLEYITVNIKL